MRGLAFAYRDAHTGLNCAQKRFYLLGSVKALNSLASARIAALSSAEIRSAIFCGATRARFAFVKLMFSK